MFTKNKFLLYFTLVMLVLLTAVFISRLALTNRAVKHSVTSGNLDEGEIKPTAWDNSEVRNLWKENNWLEKQLALSKSEKMNMGIDFDEKKVEVQLKGTVLLQAQILKQYPDPFMKNIDQTAYVNLFGHVSSIDSEWCNYPKKPIVTVIAPKDTSEVKTNMDTIREERFEWHISVENKYNIVINGVVFNADSVKEIKSYEDIYRYRKEEIKNNLYGQGHYKPTLFLWLDDKDVKAIYRAIPVKGKIIFRN